MSHNTEEWRPVGGYDDLYEVSNLGQVRSVHHVLYRANGWRYTVRDRILKQSPGKAGYLTVTLHKDGVQKTVSVHRIVLEAFKGEPEPGMECLHGDGNRKNNQLTNLRWGTRSENMQDALRHGTHHWAAKTHCIRGHQFPRPSTAGVSRDCVPCRKARYDEKKKMAS